MGIDGPLQVFISSKMSKSVLKDEREAARRAIRSLGLFARVWDWENSGCSDSCTPMEICLQAVRDSDALVLILGRDITDHTIDEHELAVELGIPDFVFVKDVRLKPQTDDYLRRHCSRCSYMKFKNPFELETSIQSSLLKHILKSYREGRKLKLGNQAASSNTGMKINRKTATLSQGKMKR